MKPLDFCTAVSYGNQPKSCAESCLELVDWYLLPLSNQKVRVIPGYTQQNRKGVTLDKEVSGFLITALKVLSYFTIIIPTIALLAKVLLRSTHKFYKIEIEEQKNASPISEKVQQLMPKIGNRKALEAKNPEVKPSELPTSANEIGRIWDKKNPPYTKLGPNDQEELPLPHILNINEENLKPLLVPIAEKEFNIRLSEIILNLLDYDLLDIPLAFLVSPEEKQDELLREFEVLSDPNRQGQVEILKSRMQDFDRAIQLKKRMKRLGFPPFAMRDLLPAWAESPLRFGLMMDDEIRLLKVSSISQVSNKMIWVAIGSRISELGRKSQECSIPTNFSEASVAEILLIDLPKIKAEQIHLCPAAFPSLTFLLMNRVELQKVETQKLTSDQLSLLFTTRDIGTASYPYYVARLTPKQINACISLIKNKKWLINLSQEQAIQLDFSKMDREIFNAVFDLELGMLGIASKAARYLPALSIEQIYQLSAFFSDNHWNYIGADHTLAFDFTKLAESEQGKVFNILFSALRGSHSKAAKLLPELDIKRIYELSSFFSDDHWNYIGTEHTLVFDFTKLAESERGKVFNILFNPIGNFSSKAAKFLPKLDINRIYELSSFFSDDHWKYIGAGHTLAFDFTKLAESEQGKVFNILFNPIGNFSSKAATLLCQLDINRIYELSSFFSDDHWKYIGTEHTLAFDFTKLPQSEREKVFNILFNPIGSFFSKAAKLLPELNINRIYELSSFFSEDHWNYIGTEHTLTFDFTKLPESERGKVFNILFNPIGNFSSKAAKLLPELDINRIYELSSLFTEDHWKYIGKENTLVLDLSKISESKREEAANALGIS